MQVLSSRAQVEKQVNALKNKQLTLGFVPTMGALHQGHISLIEKSRQSCDLSLCSIFVNPRQFNDPADLARYPRSPQKDLDLLQKAGCDLVFMPQAEELYADGGHEEYDFGRLDKVLEGAQRPGHFKGVAQVLSRLFKLVKPDKAFFGQKDYQQYLVVKELVKLLKLPLEVIPCPIVREADGLAMSSRNSLLSPEERALAANIPFWMNKARELAQRLDADQVAAEIRAMMANVNGIRSDYFEICHPEDLSPCHGNVLPGQSIALLAAYVGKIRLIDNSLL